MVHIKKVLKKKKRISGAHESLEVLSLSSQTYKYGPWLRISALEVPCGLRIIVRN